MLNFRFAEMFERFILPVDDASSRLFHLNLVIAFLLLIFWILKTYPRAHFFRELKRLFWNRHYWWNKSTKTDYQIYVTNGFLKILLIVPFLDISFEISRNVSLFLNTVLPKSDRLPINSYSLLVFTFLVFIWDDFLRFIQHRWMHTTPWLWRFHRIHHEAHVLTPITLFRAHPIELAIATLRNSVSMGVSVGVFIYLFSAQFNLVTLLGVNFFGFAFNFFGSNLRHSHIPISFGPIVETILISPKQHQIHHSRSFDHTNKNFGVSLSIWDYLWGSLVKSDSVGKLRFGLITRSTT